MKKILTIAAALTTAILMQESARAQYYKDLFMDGGINITSRKDLPSARYLGISWEAYYSAATKKLTIKDTLEQTAKMVTSDVDFNGCLLYPDGAPRFRVIYENGGKAGKHGESLTDVGRQHIRDFVAAGGSYIGTCAGAFVSSIADTDFKEKIGKCKEDQDDKVRWEYLGVYPARTLSTKRLTRDHWGHNVYTGQKIEPGCPLLKYFDFGGDMYIDSVFHNGGCFITTDPKHFAPGTEILLRYDFDKDDIRQEEGIFPISGHISTWAYKASEKSGRVVDCGSHPEGVTSGERLQLFASFILYAMDGNGCPVVKGELEKGISRQMTKKTEDNDPAFTKIGDKQYHHFTVNIPEGAKNVVVKLSSDSKDVDLNLFMKKDDFAFAKTSAYHDVTLGASKEMKLAGLEAGTWYIGVECATTVDEKKTDYGVEYTGNLEVLNGIPYSITVDWE